MKSNGSKHLLTAAIGVFASVSIFLSAWNGLGSKVAANGEKKNISIGPGVLGYYMNTSDTAMVYMGNSDYSGMTWLVVGNNQHGVASDSNYSCLTLLAYKNIGESSAFVQGGMSNAYNGSALQTSVNSIYENSFSPAEKAALCARQLPSGQFSSESPYTNGVSGTAISNAKLWPLSSQEAYQLDSYLRRNSNSYWLRSPGHSSQKGAVVSNEGVLDYLGQDTAMKLGVRPAMNVQHSSVFLVSSSVEGKPSEIVNGAFFPVNELRYNTFKMTFFDSQRQGFSAERTDYGNVMAGDTVSIRFNNAKLLTSNTDERVSVILTDNTGEILYYGTLAYRKQSGESKMRIPEELTNGKYVLKVFSEQRNDFCHSDYSSNVVDIPITVTSAPKTPLNVHAVATSNTYARVYWDGVMYADGYEVSRATSPDGPYTVLGTTTIISRSCGNLTSGRKYYFRVRSYRYIDGAIFYSDYSPATEIVTPFKAPANVKVQATSNTYAKVSWDAVSRASGYEVYRSLSASAPFTLLGTVSDTSRSCGNLPSGKMVRFKVRAYVDIDGKRYYGDFSQEVRVVTPLVAPSGMRAQATSNSYARVYWNEVPGATAYEVYRSTSLNGTYTLLGSVNDLSRSCGNLTSGKKYYFKVRAYVSIQGQNYYGSFSTPVSVITPLATPTGLKAQATSATYARLSWNTVTGAAGYEVYRSTSATGNYTLLGTVDTNSRSCGNLTASKYYFKVRAYSIVDGQKFYGDYSTVLTYQP